MMTNDQFRKMFAARKGGTSILSTPPIAKMTTIEKSTTQQSQSDNFLTSLLKSDTPMMENDSFGESQQFASQHEKSSQKLNEESGKPSSQTVTVVPPITHTIEEVPSVTKSVIEEQIDKAFEELTQNSEDEVLFSTPTKKSQTSVNNVNMEPVDWDPVDKMIDEMEFLEVKSPEPSPRVSPLIEEKSRNEKNNEENNEISKGKSDEKIDIDERVEEKAEDEVEEKVWEESEEESQPRTSRKKAPKKSPKKKTPKKRTTPKKSPKKTMDTSSEDEEEEKPKKRKSPAKSKKSPAKKSKKDEEDETWNEKYEEELKKIRERFEEVDKIKLAKHTVGNLNELHFSDIFNQ